MSLENSYGFRSAQSAFENFNPYDTDCDCEPLFRCEECETYTNEAGTCTECKDDDGQPLKLEELERDESTEGILTANGCDHHNHICETRDCCEY